MARNVDIRLRRSSVPGNIPTIEQLNLGELAINTADGKLYLKKQIDGIEQVVEVGADARSGLVSTFNTYIYTSDGTLQNISGADDYGNNLSYDLSSPRRIQVYLNGVLLHQGIDYTSPDGVTINMTYPIDSDQVVQIAAYNSEGASIDADLILDDGFAFVMGTDEETRLYHSGTNTILKHMAYGDNTFNMMWRDSDRLIMGENGINIVGELTINGNQVVTDSDVLTLIDGTVTRTFVENLDLTAGAISYDNDSNGLLATNVQAAIDELQLNKLDINSLTSSIVFYPTTALSDLSGANRLVTSLQDSDFDTVAVDVNTGIIDSDQTFIAMVASDKGVLEGSTGVINIHTVGEIRRHVDDGTGQARFYFEVYKIDSDNNEYLLGTSSTTGIVGDDGDLYEEFYADALIESTPFTSGDRVAMKYYGISVSSNTTSFDFKFGGGQPIRSTFPVAVNVLPKDISQASEVVVSTSNFDGLLSGNDDTVQKALDTLDNVTTTNVPEGTNEYFTAERARLSLSQGAGIQYNDATGEIAVDLNTIATQNFAQSVADLAGDSALTNANLYTDNQISLLDSALTSNLDSAILSLQSEIDSDLAEAKSYADDKDSDTLVLAKLYADNGDTVTLSSATAYADSAINIAITNLVDGAPEVLDTLNEIAAALGDDSDFIGTVQNWINQKLDKTATTDELAEGTTNLYHTQERVRNSVSAGNGLLYNPATGEFSVDSSYDAVFNTVTATTFNGDLNGTADNSNLLEGQGGSYYRINVYDQTGTLLN